MFKPGSTKPKLSVDRVQLQFEIQVPRMHAMSSALERRWYCKVPVVLL